MSTISLKLSDGDRISGAPDDLWWTTDALVPLSAITVDDRIPVLGCAQGAEPWRPLGPIAERLDERARRSRSIVRIDVT